jgi:hypothetical protein
VLFEDGDTKSISAAELGLRRTGEPSPEDEEPEEELTDNGEDWSAD